MNKFGALITFAVIAIAVAEPPVGYSYSEPSHIGISSIGGGIGGGHEGGGYATIGVDDYSSGGYAGGYSSGGGHGGYSLGGGGGHGGYSLGGGLGGGFGGGYTAVSSGYQTSEGKYVDPVLLHKVKEILLDHENLEESNRGYSHGGGHGGGYASISSSYGVPSGSYGVPSGSYGVPGYDSSRVVGIELGHINQAIQVAQFHQSQHIDIPSGSYGVPSGSYGVPSGSYGVPH